MKTLILIAAMVVWSGISEAQRTDIITGPHGGMLQEIADVEVELVVGDRAVTLCVYSSGDVQLDAHSYKAAVTIVSGQNIERIELQPTNLGRLAGTSPSSLLPFSSLTLDLTTPAGSTGAVEF